MAKLNRTCGICRKKYSYCPSCAADANKPTWLAIFCCENCRDLYNVINDYEYKHLTKKEALDKLNNLDLSNVEALPGSLKQVFDEILKQEKEELFVESSNIEEAIEVVEEKIIEKEIVVEEQPKVRKRSNNKKTIVNNNLIKDK